MNHPNYSLQIKCSDCNFHLVVNDRSLYHLDRGANLNTQLPINTFFLPSGNEFNCTITPIKGSDTISETAKLVIKLMQESTDGESKQISSFETPSYKVDEKNPAKSNDSLSGELKMSISYKPVLETGLALNDSPALKNELYEKYQNILTFLKENKIDEILSSFAIRNQDIASLNGQSVTELSEGIKKDYQSYVNDSSLELWEFSKDKVYLKIYGNNKIACLEVANGNQPICFMNRKDRIAIYIPLYFFRNPNTKQLDVIR